MASTHVSLDCPRVCAPPQRGLKCCTHVWGRHGVGEAHLTGHEPFAEVPVFPVSFCKMSLWYRKWPRAGGRRREAGGREHRSHGGRGDGVGQRWLASHFLVTGCVTSARLGPLWAFSPSSVDEPTRQLRAQCQPLGKRLPRPLQPPCRSLLPTCFLPSLPGSGKLATLALPSFPRKNSSRLYSLALFFLFHQCVRMCLP